MISRRPRLQRQRKIFKQQGKNVPRPTQLNINVATWGRLLKRSNIPQHPPLPTTANAHPHHSTTPTPANSSHSHGHHGHGHHVPPPQPPPHHHQLPQQLHSQQQHPSWQSNILNNNQSQGKTGNLLRFLYLYQFSVFINHGLDQYLIIASLV